MTPGTCHVCGQSVYYVPTASGQSITIDLLTSPKGNIIWEGRMARECDPDNLYEQEVAKYVSHARTCPRRRRKQ